MKYIEMNLTKARKVINKKTSNLFSVFIITVNTFAQTGIGTTAPNAAAALDITSTTQGFLPPRLTYAQRNGMILPIPAGLMVWCTDCGSNGELQVFNGSSWTKIGTSGTATSKFFSSIMLGTNIGGDVIGESIGFSVAISADGSRVITGAPVGCECVKVFDWNGSSWVQLGEDIVGVGGDRSGTSVDISNDGTKIAIGSPRSYGRGGDMPGIGQVRILDWNGFTWEQIGTAIDGEGVDEYSGISISLSADGSRIAIGAPENDSYYVGEAGHVRVYELNGSEWEQVGTDIDGDNIWDEFGKSVSLSADGTRLAIGAPANDFHKQDAGQVRVYEWKGSVWEQIGVGIYGETAGDQSGSAISISADGNRLAIGSYHNTGHVRVFGWNGSAWVQIGVGIYGETAGDQSGRSVSLSADGTRLAIGAPYNDGNGNDTGHVRVYEWNGSAWVQIGVDLDGDAAGDQSGRSVSLSADGTRVAVGAPYNDGNGNDTGHVRIFQ